MTGRDTYLTATVRGVTRAAYREAERELTKLQREVDGQTMAKTSVSLGFI